VPRRDDSYPQYFDVRAVVLFFGGPADLARRATANLPGAPLKVKAIEKWLARQRIPGNWLVRLAQLAKHEGRHFEIHDFITRRAPELTA
jgi:hypothetical protein